MMFYYQDTPINYELRGTGPVVVFLHGFLESMHMWQHIAPEFEQSHSLLLIDLPGHGASGVIQETHSMELMATVVVSLLDELELNKATFIGHSMGGYVSLACIDLFPERVEGIILMNSTPLADSPERIKNRKRALKILEINANAFISMAISNLFTSEEQKVHHAAIEALKKEALQMDKMGVTAAIRGMIERKDHTSVLKKFGKKKTLILGLEDPILDYSENIALAKVCNTPTFSVEGGHMSWMTFNSEIVKIMHFIV